ncbi:MAG: hypothetical protein AUG48_07260 [Actinobacteria bacterium 13_1_20CM_3_68_9]|nr:MAG: hypothetical protein AUG48_07260 [Actinobacteria bacterium 13_1_20CM_3_68_9]
MASSAPATILVLEENAAVQELIEQALREAGHRVLTTNNALEAIELLQRVRIDLIVVGDLVDERAETLVEELRSIQAGLRIVSISSPEDELEGIEYSARLSNPLSLDDLRDVVAAPPDAPADGSPIDRAEGQ